jgi:hypothetical protein
MQVDAAAKNRVEVVVVGLEMLLMMIKGGSIEQFFTASSRTVMKFHSNSDM